MQERIIFLIVATVHLVGVFNAYTTISSLCSIRKAASPSHSITTYSRFKSASVVPLRMSEANPEDTSSEKSNTDDHLDLEEAIETVNEILDNGSNSTALNSTESTEVDKKAAAIKEYELKLQSEIANLESTLRAERLSLSRLKDKVSESGKAGFFMVQAQVNDFQVKRKTFFNLALI